MFNFNPNSRYIKLIIVPRGSASLDSNMIRKHTVVLRAVRSRSRLNRCQNKILAFTKSGGLLPERLTSEITNFRNNPLVTLVRSCRRLRLTYRHIGIRDSILTRLVFIAFSCSCIIIYGSMD